MDEKADAASLFQIEQAFFNDGYQLATSLLTAESSSELHVQAMHQFFDVLDAFIEVFLKNAGESSTPAHCTKGCAWCCSQAVFAQDHEFKFMKSWMFSKLNVDEIERIRARAKKKYAHTKDLSGKDRLLYKEACPFLEDNVCMIYEARPVACRIYLSSDLDSCKYEYEHPGGESFPKLYNLPFLAGRKLNEGYAKGIAELGISSKEMSIEEGLHT